VTDTHNRYRRLVELSPDGIFIVQDDRLVLVNPAALRLVGATRPEQLFRARRPNQAKGCRIDEHQALILDDEDSVRRQFH